MGGQRRGRGTVDEVGLGGSDEGLGPEEGVGGLGEALFQGAVPVRQPHGRVVRAQAHLQPQVRLRLHPPDTRKERRHCRRNSRCQGRKAGPQCAAGAWLGW